MLKRFPPVMQGQYLSPLERWTGAGGPSGLVDTTTLAYLNSTAPHPTQAALDTIMDQVHAVRVFNGGCDGDTRFGSELLLETTEPTDLASLRVALRIVDGGDAHCMCFGDPTFELLSAERSRVALLGLHHGVAIRWAGWKGDAALTDGALLLAWLAQRGVPQPLHEFEAQAARRRQHQRDEEQWLAAMPPALAPLWADAVDQFGSADLAPLNAALVSAWPSEHTRILALLAWFGSGAGPWSGFPAYEQVAEALLLQYPTAHLVAAMESTPLKPAQLEGAARLFGGWEFRQQRPMGLQDLPDAWKEALWNHVKDTPDNDKRGRAMRAFCEV